MIFNSFSFIFIFLPLLLIGWYYLQGRSLKRAALLFLIAMSVIFYTGFGMTSMLILIAAALITYLISYLLAISPGSRLYMIAGVLIDLALLGYFKYSGFVLDNINMVFRTDLLMEKVILPVGISFYTFSMIAYTVDRYRGDIEHKDILTYLAYILYFPKILQGPIALPTEMLPQFERLDNCRWDRDRFARGLTLFIIGLGKKVLLADTMALIVDYTFREAYYLDTICVIIAGVACAFNIYFDFSGYCDMAEGISVMLGIELPVNFDSPFKAGSVRELWQRWHVSLSRFLTRYVYIPLGGSRKGTVRTSINIMIVFFLSGLWHGAGYTFIVWGLLNGLMVVVDRYLPRVSRGLVLSIRTLLTFLYFAFTVLFFRAENMAYALAMVRRLFFFTWPGFVFRTAESLIIPETYLISEAVRFIAPSFETAIKVILMLLAFVISAFVIRGRNAREIASDKVFTTQRALALSLLFAFSLLSLSGVQSYVYFNF